MKRLADYIWACGGVISGLALVCLAFLGYEIPHAPLRPDASQGLVFPANNHGVTRYVSATVHMVDAASFWILGGVFAFWLCCILASAIMATRVR